MTVTIPQMVMSGMEDARDGKEDSIIPIDTK
jgi:hypothetical protein